MRNRTFLLLALLLWAGIGYGSDEPDSSRLKPVPLVNLTEI